MSGRFQPDARKWRKVRHQLVNKREPAKLLDAMLALDRMVVELSMRIYNLPRRERFLMRKQNRRLHKALRHRLRPPLVTSRNPS